MTNYSKIPGGVVNGVPEDLQRALKFDPTALLVWEDITPLERNERIRWI